jgi:hypothetical protein
MEVNMSKIIFYFIISVTQLLCSSVYSQMSVKGKVFDSASREPLELAVVTDIKTYKNAITGKDGKFVLKNVKGSDSLTVSFIGYASQKIKVDLSAGELQVGLEKGQINLKEVTISTSSENLTTSRTLSRIDLNTLPMRSAQDLLRLVPGLFIAQHQGGGKAEQIFLRGFDADHGTDVNVSVDGIPVNLVSQAHGQGYADLHFVIPETIAGYDFGKGPYYADKGDFCTAGFVSYHTINILNRNTVELETGQYNTVRGLAMVNLLSDQAKIKGQNAYIAAEGLYTNGPFDVPEHFNRYNIFGKFNSKIGLKNNLTLTLSTLESKWRAAGEIPNRALSESYIKNRYGSIDSTQGGYTSRSNVNLKITSSFKNDFVWENQAYYSYCYFNLVSNFTFYYADPVNGDQFGQHEVRDLFGYKTTLSHQNYFGNAMLSSSAGIGTRYDHTHPSWLAHTLHGDSILNFIQRGMVKESNVNVYLDETLETGKWLFNIGLRFDYFNFNYLSAAPGSDTAAVIYEGVNSGRGRSILSPKVNIQYTPSSEIQFYLKSGKGFHSNDARVVIANQGHQILPAAYGADLGINWKPLPGLFINAALWYLYLQQEFTYGADFGDESVEPGGRTERKGIDLSLRYQIRDWLFANCNLNLAKPRELDAPKGGNYIPLAPTFTSTGGLYYRFKNSLNGGLSYRYLQNRAANEDYSLTAAGYFVSDLTANYTRRRYEIGLSIENLFNQTWNEAQFAYISRLRYETAPVDEVSFTPGVSFSARLKFSIFF